MNNDLQLNWNEPGRDAFGATPLGNGTLGANAWVEAGGDLLLLIGHTEAWSAHHRLLKLGQVRIRCAPAILGGTPYEETLDLAGGEFTINAGAVTTRVRVDEGVSRISVEIDSPMPIALQVVAEPWRLEQRPLRSAEMHSAYGAHGEGAAAVVETPDVFESMPDAICWWHRNEGSIWERNHRLQGMDEWIGQAADPLRNRTCGCLVRGPGLKATDRRTLAGKGRTHWSIAIQAHVAQTQSPADWIGACLAAADKADRIPVDEWRARTRAWWQAFWQRSHLRIHNAGEEGRLLTEAWHLHRYLMACQSRGLSMAKFNGGIFNLPVPGCLADGSDADPDYRRWGGAYWHQNQRQMYWPLLASGDFDLCEPFIRHYRDALSYARARTRRWFGHEGAFFPETHYRWGAYVDENYGRNRAGKPIDHADNPYTRRHWQGNLELLAFLLDYAAVTTDEDCIRESLLPLAREIIAFYDAHYPRRNGCLRMEPAQAMETLWDVVNPTPDIAGLHHVLPRLAALPQADAAFRERCLRLIRELPTIPTMKVEGNQVIAPAEVVRGDAAHNTENLALWAVFPYRCHYLGQGDLALARRTYERRPHRDVGRCWQNSQVFAAWLGLTEEARTGLAERCQLNTFGNVTAGPPCGHRFRFPAFYGGGDWVPDHDNGGVIMQALQAMLLQAGPDGGKITLRPAWPAEWDAEFKLHAPGRTVVQGTVTNGAVHELQVTPAGRRHDVDIGVGIE